MLWQLSVLGIALALNNAMAAVAIGSQPMGRWKQVKIAFTFSLFEALMPIVGVFCGQVIAHSIGSLGHYVGIGILAATGLYTLLKPNKEQTPSNATLQWKIVGFAVLLSLDNLAVGFSLGLFSVPFALAAVVFGAVSLVMTFLGLEVGRLVHSRMNVPADRLTGTVLLVTACVMVFV